MSTPTAVIDRRFGHPQADPTPWADVEALLRDAELYWITTVRADGRPHVTPLVGVWVDGSFAFTTGLDEQKGHNLAHRDAVAVTTGVNTWAAGLDVVVEGTATAVTDRAELVRIADAYDAKYGDAWHWDVDDDGFTDGERRPTVFRVAPEKVLAFAKDPHAQTRFAFGS